MANTIVVINDRCGPCLPHFLVLVFVVFVFLGIVLSVAAVALSWT